MKYKFKLYFNKKKNYKLKLINKSKTDLKFIIFLF